MPTKKTVIVFLFTLVGYVFGLVAQQEPRTYVSFKTEEKIIIDGIANENSWEKAEWSSNFIDIEGALTPKYQTNVKMIWDDNYLHFYAELEEPHIWGTLKQKDTVIFYNNDFEIFIDPDGDTHNYIEFEVNVLNTIWDLYLTKPYRNKGNILNNWNMKGLKSAVQVNGTLNDPSDTDQSWSVEISIPWKILGEAYGGTVPPENNFWRMNFSRVNWEFDLENNHYSRKRKKDGSYETEFNWVWSPQQVVNMHEPERWGYVYFTTEDSKVRHFVIPNDEYIKWYMYEIYRKTMLFNDDIEKLSFPNKTIKGELIEVKVKDEILGFTISTVSPFSGKRLMIDKDGKFHE